MDESGQFLIDCLIESKSALSLDNSLTVASILLNLVRLESNSFTVLLTSSNFSFVILKFFLINESTSSIEFFFFRFSISFLRSSISLFEEVEGMLANTSLFIPSISTLGELLTFFNSSNSFLRLSKSLLETVGDDGGVAAGVDAGAGNLKQYN